MYSVALKLSNSIPAIPSHPKSMPIPIKSISAGMPNFPENLSAAIHKIRTIATKIISNVIQSPFPYIYEPQNKFCAHIIRQLCNKG